jgi:transketolase
MAMAEKIRIEMNPPKIEVSAMNLPRNIMKYNPTYRVFCIVGDGECHEGQIWEAAMFAGKYKLDNLINIVDYNKFCIDGPTETIMPLAPLDQKFRDFGWWVKEIDGHNLAEIVDTLDLANRLYGDGKPKCIIAHTVKGHGIPLWEKIHAHVARGDCMDVALKEAKEIYG